MNRLMTFVCLCALPLGLIFAGASLAADPQGPSLLKKDGAKDTPKKGEGKKRIARKPDVQPVKADDKKPAAPPCEQPKAKEDAKTDAKAAGEKKDADKKDAAADDKAGKTADKPATYKVKKRPLKIEVTLDGTFESQHVSEVALRCDDWSEFEVLKAVEHGTEVKQGDLLIALNTERIDRTITDMEREQILSRLSLAESELQLKTLQETVPLDLAANDRTHRISDEDLQQFLKVDRPLSERLAAFAVKMAESMLEYEQEELRQLEKMYKADDLVEETEEIVLKRARDAVERAKFSVERIKSERDAFLKMTIPRNEELIKSSHQREALAYKKAQVTIPASLRRAELALERMKVEAQRSDDKLKKLRADRTQMQIKSPASGIVYYGKWVRGRWSASEMTADKLRRGGRLTNEDVVMTVVSPRPLQVHSSVSEKQLRNVTAGLAGFAQPAALPDVRLPVIVHKVGTVPLTSRDYDCVLSVSLNEAAEMLMPGMTCEVKLTVCNKPDALAIPAAALGSDDTDPRKRYVCLVGADGKPARHEVTLGRRGDKLVEIVEGLKEGDEILAEAGEDKAESGKPKTDAKPAK